MGKWEMWSETTHLTSQHFTFLFSWTSESWDPRCWEPGLQLPRSLDLCDSCGQFIVYILCRILLKGIYILLSCVWDSFQIKFQVTKSVDITRESQTFFIKVPLRGFLLLNFLKKWLSGFCLQWILFWKVLHPLNCMNVSSVVWIPALLLHHLFPTLNLSKPGFLAKLGAGQVKWSILSFVSCCPLLVKLLLFINLAWFFSPLFLFKQKKWTDRFPVDEGGGRIIMSLKECIRQAPLLKTFGSFFKMNENYII